VKRHRLNLPPSGGRARQVLSNANGNGYGTATIAGFTYAVN
jgi:hypothetical protein